jgi:D-3-phosphoglycerate dehydrogenase / 2-oxoglutarate reductase
MPKIIFTTSSFDLANFEGNEALIKNGYEFLINPFGRRLTEDQVDVLLTDDVVAMVAGLEPLTRRVLENAKGLKVIARCGIGMDNVDLVAAREKGISVFNTPDAPTRAVAEITLAHILSLCRRIPETDASLRSGKWSPLMGRLLARQTVGIVGFGRIGKMVAELLSGFGCRIIVFDPYPVSIVNYVTLVSLDELLQESDIVTLHLPYISQTHHLINQSRLDQMKSNSLLINVARGGLIDEAALLKTLEAKKIGGAALDCFEEEPYSGPLLSLPNIQVTAHMGSYAKEARSMMESEACALLVKGLNDLGFL